MSRSRVVLSTATLLALTSVVAAACGSTDRSAAAPAASPSGSSAQASSQALIKEGAAVSAANDPAATSVVTAPVPPRVRWKSAPHEVVLSLRPGQGSGPVTEFHAVLATAVGKPPADNARYTTCSPPGGTAEVNCSVGSRPGQQEVWVRSVVGTDTSPWLVVAVKADGGQCTVLDSMRGFCVIGDTGPGGGYVFYDAGSRQSWGRYLEAAPAGWSGSAEDPKKQWCSKDSNAFFSDRPKDPSIGAGATNTEVIIQECGIDTAAGAAASYRTMKGDWYLPSAKEAEAMMSVRTQIGITQPTNYWTSTQHTKVTSGFFSGASNVYFDNEFAEVSDSGALAQKDWLEFVRPIRAF